MTRKFFDILALKSSVLLRFESYLNVVTSKRLTREPNIREVRDCQSSKVAQPIDVKTFYVFWSRFYILSSFIHQK